MNHLAHCLLSFDDPELLLGNFIGDFVKGRAWEHYPPGVQRGILLHRAIDGFTDAHPLAQRSAARLRPLAGRYAQAFVDILYDHVLARLWATFGRGTFEAFADATYQQLEARATGMPEVLQERLPRMLAGRFLHGYRSREGLDWVLGRFGQRLPMPLNTAGISDLFFQEIAAFEADFQGFFPELEQHARAFSQQPVSGNSAPPTR